ncbi:MAG: PepSY domain-containing protein [Sphingomicrobium sp.]
MRKALFRFGAGCALACFLTTTALEAAPAQARLRLPPPSAPANQIYSPASIARDLEKRGYRIEKMKRKGTTYSIKAIGPNRNKVQMTVDGRSGDIVGLAVLEAATGLAAAIAVIVRSGKGSRYVDDSHPFGIIIPDTYQSRWTTITTNVWTTYSGDYVTESWSGAGYRFAVPYDTIRPGHNGFSVTTFDARELSDPVYDVYDYDGTQISTEYSEENWEIESTESIESTWGTLNEGYEESYLDGSIDEDGEIDVEDIEDYDSEDGDFSMSDDGGDDYDADVGEDEDEGYDDDDDGEGYDDEGNDGDDGDDDYDDGGDDDDGGYDDGGDEPDALSVR